MNINQKLALSEKTNTIYFFREGLFAQLFNVSLYLAVTQLGLGVKVSSHRYKKLNNTLILKAGLPTSLLEERYSAVIKHSFGYELQGDWQFNQEDYQIWYQQQLNVQLAIEAAKNGGQLPKKANDSSINTNSKLADSGLSPIGTRLLPLTEQEYQFLTQWQQDKYPASIEAGFIRGLSQKVIIEQG